MPFEILKYETKKVLQVKVACALFHTQSNQWHASLGVRVQSQASNGKD